MRNHESGSEMAQKGFYHKISAKDLDRYVHEFAGQHNVRELDTIEQTGAAVDGIGGKPLMYRDLIGDDGLDSGVGS